MNLTYDVIIIGAGVAGLSAAVTATRKGYKTLLVDQGHSLGGTLQHAHLQEICGLFYGEKNATLLNGGLSKEIYNYLQHKSGRPVKRGRVFTLPFQNVHFLHFFESELNNQSNFNVIYNQSVVTLTIKDDTIISVGLDNGDVVSSNYIVSCTGSDNLLCRYGLSEKNVEEQLGGVFFSISGITQLDTLFSIKIPYVLKQAVMAGELPHYAQFTSASKLSDDTLLLKLNIPKDMDKTVFQEMIQLIVECLVREIPALQGALKQLSSHVVPRSAPLFKGRGQLTKHDIINGTSRFPSSIKGSWPIEFWNHDVGVKFNYVENNKYYDIPDACLQSAIISNLHAAGCSISTTSKAQAAIRVMGSCIATGERAVNLFGQ